MRPELFDQAGFGVSLCLQRRFGYTFVFFLSELTGRLLVLPLDCFAEGRLRFVADTERDLSETVVVLADQARRSLHAHAGDVSLLRFADDPCKADRKR